MRNRFTNLGWLITIIVAVTPAFIWLFTQQTQWDTTKLVFENLGKIAGLIGISLFAWNVILSARLKIYDKFFLGLDNTYRAHHIIGCIAIILLMIHPILITIRYQLSSAITAYEFVKPSLESPFKLLGSLLLITMIIIMFIVLFINVRYQRFILLQRVLGALLFIGGIHAVFVGGSDINSLLGLQIYVLGLIAVAAGVYIYRSLFHKSFHKFESYRLESVITKGSVTELVLINTGEPIVHQPGQFAFLKFNQEGVLGESHPFTISSPPSDGKLRFSVKNLGDYTAAISALKPGMIAKIDGAYGSFSSQIINNKRQVWVAGGIGVTPFLAMAGALAGDQQIDLYYSTKTKQDAVYLEELQNLTKDKSNVILHPYTTEDSGLLTADYILKASQKLNDAAFLICGPASMMQALRQQLRAKKVPSRNIHTEEFELK